MRNPFFLFLFFLGIFLTVRLAIPFSSDSPIEEAGGLLEEVEDPFLSPPLSLPSLTGEEIHLSRFKGKKVVLLTFWATWCGPCKEEMPSLQVLYKKLKTDPFEVLAINLQEEKKEVQAFVKAFSLSFPILLDRKGTLQTPYQVWAIPSSFVIDLEGMVRYKTLGRGNWDNPQDIGRIRSLFKR